MDKLHYYDGLVSVLISDLKNTAENNTISLGQFDSKNDSHMCIFSVACITQDLFGLKLSIQLNFIDYLKFIFKYHCRKKIKRCKTIPVVNCVTLVKLIEDANQPNILADIYNQYYRGNK